MTSEITPEAGDGPEQESPKPDAQEHPASWKSKMVEWLQFIRSTMVNAVIIGAIIAILVFTAKDIWRQPVIIEKFGLPPMLTERGFSGAVTAQRVWDAMTVIQREAGTLKRTQSLLAESRQLDVVEPGTGLSLRSLTQMLRSLAGIEQTRIAGEFVCAEETCDWGQLSLRLRVFTEGRMYIVNSGPVADREPDELFRESALAALKIIDPYVYAAYLFAKDDSQIETAVEIANELVDTNHDQSAWAANLLGNYAQGQGRHEEAIEWFDRSILIAKDIGPRKFALPHYGRGNSLLALKKHELALEAFAQAIGYDKNYASPHYGKGQTLMAMKDFTKAADAFRVASELDRRNAAHWAGLGDAMKQLEDPVDALKNLERAVRLNASFVPARLALGRLLVEQEDLDAARRHLKIVITLQPDNVQGWDAFAMTYSMLGEDDKEEDALKKAAEIRVSRIGKFGSKIFADIGWMVPDL